MREMLGSYMFDKFPKVIDLLQQTKVSRLESIIPHILNVLGGAASQKLVQEVKPSVALPDPKMLQVHSDHAYILT